MRILHLTDPHIPAPGAASGDDRPLRSFDRLMASVDALEALNLVLVTGDIADDGSYEAGAVARHRLARFAARHGLAQIYLPGNTDDRDAFRAVFGSGHLDSAGRDVAVRRLDGPECAAVSEHHGVRVVTLDSTVPGAMHGSLGEDQLSWLESVLAAPAPRGTVVALHHPPISIKDSPFLSSVALRASDRLGRVIEGTDVHVVLAGHFHIQAMGFLGTVPVWVSPAVESRVDLTAPHDRLRFVLEPGASIVGLPPDGPPYFHAIQARDPGRELREVSLRKQ